MPQELIVKDREYYNQITNGFNVDNYSSSADFLHGNVGGRVAIRKNYTLWWYVYMDNDEWVYQVEGTDTRIISTLQENFISEGWKVGDQLKITVAYLDGLILNTQDFVSATILEVYNDQLVIDSDFTVLDTYDEVLWINMSNVTDLQGAEYRFGFGENEDVVGNDNLMTNESQSLYIESISNVLGGMKPLGESLSWQTGIWGGENIAIRELNKEDKVIAYDEDAFTFTDVVYSFDVLHRTKLPTYTEEEIENIINNIPPPLYNGDASIKYSSVLELRRQYSDPNEVVEIEDVDEKGSIGWFGEEFNGYNPKYSLQIYNVGDISGNPTDKQLDIAGNQVLIQIETSEAGYIADQISLNYIMLNSEDVYTVDTRNNSENIRYDSVQGGGGDSDTRVNEVIESYTVTQVSPTIIRIQATIKPNNSSGVLDNDLIAEQSSEYLLYAIVGDSTKTAALSGIQSIIIDTNNYLENTDIPDLLEVESFEVQNYDLDPTTDYVGANQDAVKNVVRFKTDYIKGAFLESLNVKYIGYNDSTEEEFTIKTTGINFDSELVGGKQIISEEQDLGLNKYNDLLNIFKFNSDNSDSQWQFYDLELPSTIPFRENISISSGMSEDQRELFYDNSQTSNGLSEKTSNYSGKNGYEVRQIIEFSIASSGVSTIYQIMSPKFVIFDYDEMIS